MIALFKKEINTFFSSPMAYLVIGVFLLINGLFLLVFQGDFNVFNSGLASLQGFFGLAPWVLLFLVPAVTMRSFSEERKQGTLELLLTKPISPFQIILGKYLGAFTLVCIAVLPTLLYCVALSELRLEQSEVDYGGIIGAYIGLMFLIIAYVAIGVFTSSVTNNQIVAFTLSVFICFFFFFGFQGLARLNILDNYISMEQLGMSYHFKSMERGVLDTRNVIYFLSLAVAFLGFTNLILKKR